MIILKILEPQKALTRDLNSKMNPVAPKIIFQAFFSTAHKLFMDK